MAVIADMKQFFTNTRTGLFIYTILLRYWKVGCSYRAASLVYSTLLCLVPFIFVSMTLLSWLPGYDHLHDPIMSSLASILTPSQMGKVQTTIEEFLSRFKYLSMYNVVFLLFTCVWMIYNMAAALNEIWKAHVQRAWGYSLIVYIVTVIIGPLSMGALSIIWAIVKGIPYLHGIQDIPWLTAFVSSIAPYVIFAALLTILNVVLPSAKVPWSAALLGSLVTLALFILLKWAFVAIVMNRATYHILYGGLAIIPLFMIWLYLLWAIILLGALIAFNLTNGLSLASLKKLAKES